MGQALMPCSCLALMSVVAAKLASFKQPDDFDMHGSHGWF